MAFTEVNGVKLWYKTTGEGTPVVHIHGAGFGHFNFATATPIASKYFRCIDFDMRGYGQSDKPIQSYDMEVWGRRRGRPHGRAEDRARPTSTARRWAG